MAAGCRQDEAFAASDAFFVGWALWRAKVCGYTAARANILALRPDRSRLRDMWKMGP